MSTTSDSTERIRLDLVEALRSAVSAHTAGRIFDIDDGMGELELRIARVEGPDHRRLALILEFWSGWSDSAGHGWLFYPGMGKDTWCPMATSIIDDLVQDREVSDPKVAEMFGPRPQTRGILERMRSWWRKTAG